MKKKIIISAVNLYTGGTFSILVDVLTYLSRHLSTKYEVIALVHKKEMLPDFKGITLIEFPDSRNSWFRRLYYEFFYFKKISRDYKPYLWLSLHDISPNVTAEVKAVYCHNASAFYQVGIRDFLMEPGFAFQNLYYEYLYRFNLNSNDFVIVQQNWLRDKFKPWFKKGKVIVSYPILPYQKSANPNASNKEEVIFFYPSLPRVFKNFETACKAAVWLQEKGIFGFKLQITVKGDENKYAKFLYNQFKKYSFIEFVGLLSREEVFDAYEQADCLVFPSKLESWGMPVSEFKSFHKPILISDLPYAHETINDYPLSSFFDPNDYLSLAKLMQDFLEDRIVYNRPEKAFIDSPFASDWEELFRQLLPVQKQLTQKEKAVSL